MLKRAKSNLIPENYLIADWLDLEVARFAEWLFDVNVPQDTEDTDISAQYQVMLSVALTWRTLKTLADTIALVPEKYAHLFNTRDLQRSYEDHLRASWDKLSWYVLANVRDGHCAYKWHDSSEADSDYDYITTLALIHAVADLSGKPVSLDFGNPSAETRLNFAFWSLSCGFDPHFMSLHQPLGVWSPFEQCKLPDEVPVHIVQYGGGVPGWCAYLNRRGLLTIS